MEHSKYAKFEEIQTHSSDEEIELAPYSIDDMLCNANKDPQPGKITFIVKIVRDREADFHFVAHKTRPPSKQTLEVKFVKSCGEFEMYEVETNSNFKKAAIKLMVG